MSFPPCPCCCKQAWSFSPQEGWKGLLSSLAHRSKALSSIRLFRCHAGGLFLSSCILFDIPCSVIDVWGQVEWLPIPENLEVMKTLKFIFQVSWVRVQTLTKSWVFAQFIQDVVPFLSYCKYLFHKRGVKFQRKNHSTGWFSRRKTRINNYNSLNNLLLKTKLGRTEPVPASPGRSISPVAAVRPAVLAATVVKMECCVGLCLQAEGNQFQHLL
jgi:hypothetical protein